MTATLPTHVTCRVADRTPQIREALTAAGWPADQPNHFLFCWDNGERPCSGLFRDPDAEPAGVWELARHDPKTDRWPTIGSGTWQTQL